MTHCWDVPRVRILQDRKLLEQLRDELLGEVDNRSAFFALLLDTDSGSTDILVCRS